MGAATVVHPLAELFTRAGASDTDKEKWLAERRAGVTATEVRDLANGKVRQQDLIDLKLGRKEDSFRGNAYTEWGKEREPVIAGFLVGLGIQPETRVFHHADNPRHLASPDGIGTDFDEHIELSEIKTSGVFPLPLGSKELADKGYVDQIQWCLYVTGGVRCALVVEERLNVDHPREGEPVFEPGRRDLQWVERDDKRIAELVKVADEFLAELDRQRDEGGPVIDEAVDTHAVNYLRGLAAEKEGKALKESSYRALIELGVSQESPLARVTITPGTSDQRHVEEVVDLDAAAAALPKEWAQLQRAVKRVESLQAAFDVLADAHTKKVTVVVKGKPARATVTAGKGTKK